MNIDKNLLTQYKETLENIISRLSGEQDVTDDLKGVLAILNSLPAPNNEQAENFPNGIDSYLETHYDISCEIQLQMTKAEIDIAPLVYRTDKDKGIMGLNDLSRNLTTKFEQDNKGIEWGKDKEYFDTLEEFLLIEFKKEQEAG